MPDNRARVLKAAATEAIYFTWQSIDAKHYEGRQMKLEEMKEIHIRIDVCCVHRRELNEQVVKVGVCNLVFWYCTECSWNKMLSLVCKII